MGACRDIADLLQVMMLTASTKKDTGIEAAAAGAPDFLQKHSVSGEPVGDVKRVAQGRVSGGDILGHVGG